LSGVGADNLRAALIVAKRAAQGNENGDGTQMMRRTEINIELTRTLHIRRPAAPCECTACAAQGEPDGQAAAVLIDVTTRALPEGSETDQGDFVENADSSAAIEIDSAEGQLILAAAVRSLEQRLSAQSRAALRCPPELTLSRRRRFTVSLSAKLRRLRHVITHPKSTRRTR
jgi:hypothetical protein